MYVLWAKYALLHNEEKTGKQHSGPGFVRCGPLGLALEKISDFHFKF